MGYNVDYFIEFFGKIPENMWCILSGGGGIGCALTHLNGYEDRYFDCEKKGTKGYALISLFKTYYNDKGIIHLGSNYDKGISYVWRVNDDEAQKDFKGANPKERIMNVLYDIKFKEVNRLISNIEEKELSTNKEKQNELSTCQ